MYDTFSITQQDPGINPRMRVKTVTFYITQKYFNCTWAAGAPEPVSARSAGVNSSDYQAWTTWERVWKMENGYDTIP